MAMITPLEKTILDAEISVYARIRDIKAESPKGFAAKMAGDTAAMVRMQFEHDIAVDVLKTLKALKGASPFKPRIRVAA